MPDVTIETRRRRAPAERRALIDAVHAAMVELDMFAGRSLEAKKALDAALVRNPGALGVPALDIKILLREIPTENRGVRGGLPASEVDLGSGVDV
jgi:phenylpyruvate tautomerase PptA (4-oxalocrotonate tautomerase family)